MTDHWDGIYRGVRLEATGKTEIRPIDKTSTDLAGVVSELDYVGGLGSLLALGDVETDPLVLGEGAEPAVLDGGVVDEEIGASFIRRNETESLFSVEPLHSALSHSNFLGQ